MDARVLCAFVCLSAAVGSKLPPPEVKMDVLHKPFVCNRRTVRGDSVHVHYTGYYENGTQFHTRCHNQGEPVWFTLGIGEVIKGWDHGLLDMCKGEKRKLTIPPELAYGKEGKGKRKISLARSFKEYQELVSKVKEYLRQEFEKAGVPSNDTFHEQLVKDIFKKEDENEDGYISAREFTFIHDEL
uniref:peptidylprolyl isomerase n=1 Tax=Eptatretus burgeri TaxID=7764 RepID=A0A8C4N2A1_EPTBU